MLFTFSSLETLDWQFRAKYNLAGYREWLRCNKQVWPVTTSESLIGFSAWVAEAGGELLWILIFFCPVVPSPVCTTNSKNQEPVLALKKFLGVLSAPGKCSLVLQVECWQYQPSSRFLPPGQDVKHRPQTITSSLAVGRSGESLGMVAFGAAGWAAKSARVNLEHVWLYRGGVMLLP